MTPLELVLSKVDVIKKSGNEHNARCPGPSHKKGDRHPSLSISETPDGTVLINCHKTDCVKADVMAAMGLEMKDLFADSKTLKNNLPVYDYTDADGKLIYQVERKPGGNFLHRIPDGHGGVKYKGDLVPDGRGGHTRKKLMDGIERVPYRLHEVVKAVAAGETVYICEGEKDCDRLASLGLTATTNSGGAGNWKAVHSQHLKGGKVVIFPDNDETGRTHVQKVAKSLTDAATGATIKIVELPGLPEKGDVSDWLTAGHTVEELLALIGGADYRSPIGETNGSNNSTQVGVPAGNNEGIIAPTNIYKTFKPVDVFLNETPPEAEWLVEERIPKGWLAMIAGDTKTGKTLIALDLAMAVATGGEFLGKPANHGNVLLLLMDDPTSLTSIRLNDYGFKDQANVYVYAQRYESEMMDSLSEAMATIKPVLIVVDTLIKCVPKSQGAENDSGVMDEVIERFGRITANAENPPTVLFITHLARKGNVRGSTAIEGATPMVMMAKQLKEENRHVVELRFEWKLEPVEPMVIELENNHFIVHGSKQEYGFEETERKIKDYITKAGDDDEKRKIRVIAQSLGIREQTARKVLENSRSYIQISQKTGQRGSPSKLWFLKEDLRSQTRTPSGSNNTDDDPTAPSEEPESSDEPADPADPDADLSDFEEVPA